MAFCTECGAANDVNSKFCSACGCRLKSAGGASQIATPENQSLEGDVSDSRFPVESAPRRKSRKGLVWMIVILSMVLTIATVGGIAYGVHRYQKGKKAAKKIEEERERKRNDPAEAVREFWKAAEKRDVGAAMDYAINDDGSIAKRIQSGMFAQAKLLSVQVLHKDGTYAVCQVTIRDFRYDEEGEVSTDTIRLERREGSWRIMFN